MESYIKICIDDQPYALYPEDSYKDIRDILNNPQMLDSKCEEFVPRRLIKSPLSVVTAYEVYTECPTSERIVIQTGWIFVVTISPRGDYETYGWTKYSPNRITDSKWDYTTTVDRVPMFIAEELMKRVRDSSMPPNQQAQDTNGDADTSTN